MSTKKYEDPSKSCRPFDQDRSGFILGQLKYYFLLIFYICKGEGSGILVLEELEHAL